MQASLKRLRQRRQCRSHARKGSAMVEFTLVFIPLLFLICSTVEFGRAMWSYHTLAGSVKTGARYAIVHGARCFDTGTCQASLGNVAETIRYAGRGLDPARMSVTLTSGDEVRTCSPLSSCIGDGSLWPPAGENAVGRPILIEASYSFESVLSSFWPGQSRASFDLIASSREVIQF